MVQKLINFLEMEDVKKLIKNEKDKRYKLAIALAAGSGLRISEIVGPAPNSNQDIKPLTKEKIDLSRRQIKLFGKGKKERITVTSPWLNETNIKLLPLKIPRRTVQYHFGVLCKRVLGKHYNFHILRHSWANHLANHPNPKKRVSLPTLMILGGWARLDTVGIYAKSNPIKAVEAAWESF